MPRPRQPTLPPPAATTPRHALCELLRGAEFTARELSMQAHLPEKEVYLHLEHLRRTLQAGAAALVVTPAACRGCGFVFAKRTRLTPPSRCPLCRSETILPPRFAIRTRQEGAP